MSGTLTFNESVRLHRELWTWISDKTIETEVCMIKEDFFKTYPEDKIPHMCCWCCEYNSQLNKHDCSFCPIQWGNNNTRCVELFTDYSYWLNAVQSNDYLEASKAAMKIAKLPTRKTRINIDIL